MRSGKRFGAGPFWPCSLLLACILVLATACTQASVSAPSATATRAPSPAGSPAVYPKALDMRSAWGNVPVHSIPTAMGSDRVFVFDQAVTSDGQWLVGAIAPRDLMDNTTQPSYAVLYNIASGQIVTMHKLLAPQSQILQAASDGDWVVWSEADNQPGFSNWVLFAYNRQTRQVTQLAKAARVNGQPVDGPYPWPEVDHNLVIWAQAIGPIGSGDYTNLIVRMADLTTGKITTLATKAAGPSFSWPWVCWGQQTSGTSGYLAFENLQTGQTLQEAEGPQSLALAGVSMGYIQDGALYMVDDFTQGISHPVRLTPNPYPNYPEFPSMNDRIFAWQASNITEVYDRAEHRIVILPVINGNLWAWVSGHTLVWLDRESEAQSAKDPPHWDPTPTLYAVDTNTLPVLSVP
ncbi:MAG: hypothetical protein OJF49_003304 [Ktedonobacterales bacterium]|nr:MAG: hypothetical protein OJF49_003304 [Ktedonobacterales bacterium]